MHVSTENLACWVHVPAEAKQTYMPTLRYLVTLPDMVLQIHLKYFTASNLKEAVTQQACRHSKFS